LLAAAGRTSLNKFEEEMTELTLKNSKMVGFLATSRSDIAKRFYDEILDLTLIEETPYALVFESVNAVIRIQKTEDVFPPPYTTIGWEVENIEFTVRALSDSGVQFERYEGMNQDDLGVWNIPNGSKVAWFKDPDGNLLSLTQVV
jgi:catechol 2,3-dioxygenase-like lactoylglutathione lyase family enzyme